MTNSSVDIEQFESSNLADNVTSLFSQWDSGRQVWLHRVRETLQYVYATSTQETTNSKNPWNHTTVVPKLTQIHDNLGANYSDSLFSQPDWLSFEAATLDDSTDAKRKAVENYLQTKHEYSGFYKTMSNLLRDWVSTGNCFCRVEYVREVEEDSNGLKNVTYEGPRVMRISPYDIVFDHTVERFEDSPKVFREMISRGELIRRLEDWPETYDESEVARMREFISVISGMETTDINKSIQMNMDGFTDAASYFNSGKVELLHFMGDIYDPTEDKLYKSRQITVVDRRFVIKNEQMDDLQGYGRIYHSAWRSRPDNLWGMGPLDNIVGMQYLINHLENARADGFDQMLAPDRVHTGNVETQKEGPVTNYWIDDPQGQVYNLAPDRTVLTADNEIMLKEHQMEAYAGAPRQAMGIRTPGEKTAFEVSVLENAAHRLFEHKLVDFERDIIEPVVNGELEAAVRNLNSLDVAKVLDDDFGVIEFRTITRDDLTAKGKIRARGASHFAKRAKLVQELQQFSLVLAQDPSMAVHYPAKARAKAWNQALGFDDFTLFQPFGQVEEAVEMQEHQRAAQQEIAQQQAVEQTEMESQGIPAEAATQGIG